MTEKKSEKKGFLTAFDEFHELVVWTLLLGGGAGLFFQLIERGDFLVILGVAFAIMSGFKLRSLRLGKLELTGEKNDE